MRMSVCVFPTNVRSDTQLSETRTQPSTPTHSFSLSTDAELMEMIERADTDGDGEISPDEFYAIMTKKTFT